MSKVKNYIFDLGGVILAIDPQEAYRRFVKLSLDGRFSSYNLHSQDDAFKQIETGDLSLKDFRDYLRTVLARPEVEDHQIDEAWNGVIQDFIPGVCSLLETLRPSSRIFLLSNTNKIHIDYFKSVICEHHGGYSKFEKLFDRIYYSYEVGLRKPDEEIFKYVLAQEEIEAHETMFIDDSHANIISAKNVGLEVFHVQQGLIEQGFKEALTI